MGPVSIAILASVQLALVPPEGLFLGAFPQRSEGVPVLYPDPVSTPVRGSTLSDSRPLLGPLSPGRVYTICEADLTPLECRLTEHGLWLEGERTKLTLDLEFCNTSCGRQKKALQDKLQRAKERELASLDTGPDFVDVVTWIGIGLAAGVAVGALATLALQSNAP